MASSRLLQPTQPNPALEKLFKVFFGDLDRWSLDKNCDISVATEISEASLSRWRRREELPKKLTLIKSKDALVSYFKESGTPKEHEIDAAVNTWITLQTEAKRYREAHRNGSYLSIQCSQPIRT